MKRFKVLIVICIVLFTTNLYADMRVFIGDHEYSPLNIKEDNNYSWYSVSYAPITDVNEYFSYINTTGVALICAKGVSVPFVEYRLLGRLYLYNFYIQGGLGLSYGLNPDELPHLANSDLYGLISAEIGYKYKNISFGYSWEHISSPFHDDCGMNVGALVIQIEF